MKLPSKRYIRPHETCPYYKNGKCSRTGCLFLTPCTAVNKTISPRRFIEIKESED